MVNEQIEDEKKYSLQEAVRLYGSEEHKETVIQDNKNLIGNSFKSFITTMKQYYETVKVTGRGKKREILCSGEYAEKQTRKTGHEDRIPYYHFFEQALLFELAHRDKDNMRAQTRLMYAKNFEFLADEMFNDYYNHSHLSINSLHSCKDEKKKNEKIFEKIKKLDEELLKIKNEKMNTYFLKLEIKRLNEELLEINKQKMKEFFLKIEIQNMDYLMGKALKKLSEKGKIKVTEYTWVRELSQAEQEDLIEKAKKENRELKIMITGKDRRAITEKELDLATRFDDEMQAKYNMKSQLYIPLYKKHSFEYNNFFNELGIKYIYKKYKVEVLDFSSSYGRYDVMYSLIQFKEGLKRTRAERAIEREYPSELGTCVDYLEFFNEYEYPENIKVQLLVGKEKPAIEFDIYDDFEKAREEIRKHLTLKDELHLIEGLEHEEQAYLEQA